MNEMRRNAKKRPAVKKVFALLLVLSMFCTLLAGCGRKEETDNVTVRVGGRYRHCCGSIESGFCDL